jgi:hypothetical protein
LKRERREETQPWNIERWILENSTAGVLGMYEEEGSERQHMALGVGFEKRSWGRETDILDFSADFLKNPASAILEYMTKSTQRHNMYRFARCFED